MREGKARWRSGGFQLACEYLYGFTWDYWLLCSIPFIVLGRICAAPNLNLADGCLVMIAVAFGVALGAPLFRRLGEAFVAGSFAGWIGGAIENRMGLARW